MHQLIWHTEKILGNMLEKGTMERGEDEAINASRSKELCYIVRLQKLIQFLLHPYIHK